MLKNYVKQITILMLCAGMSTFAFAEEAPVYDADNFPPQFDGQPDSGAQQNLQPQPLAQDQSQDQVQEAPAPEHATNTPSTQNMNMDQRMARIERQVNNMAQMDTQSKLGDMQSELQSLRGQVETLTHQLEKTQSQQKTMYADLDKRLGSHPMQVASASSDDAGTIDDDGISTDQAPAPSKPAKKSSSLGAVTKAAVATPSVAQTDNQPNVAEEQQIYQTAYNLIKAKKYSDAAAQLQKMLQKYPSGQFAANAHYWLGELNSMMGKNDQAITEFSTVLKNYPDSPKLADAQLKLGLIYAGLFKWSNAKTAFKKVINNYPGTASARLAAEQLKQLKAAGH